MALHLNNVLINPKAFALIEAKKERRECVCVGGRGING